MGDPVTAPVSVDLEALSKLAREATPGPYERLASKEDGRPIVTGASLGGRPVVARCPYECDADFLAALSPEVVLSLVSRVREAEREGARLREAGRSVVDSAPAGVVAHDHGIGVPMPSEACHGCRLRDALGTLAEVLK
jgi:hypothetical protein